MMKEPDIRIGIITDGLPDVKRSADGCRISNLLIGDGFHWQENRSVLIKGELSELYPAEGNIHIINTLPLEKYLTSVIGSEMNPGAPAEFLKAHAVISRGWALRKITRRDDKAADRSGSGRSANEIIEWEESDSHAGFDVCSDDHCQRYQGFTEKENRTISNVISETRGMVLTDSFGNIADTRFSKCCGGRTEIFSSCWDDLDYDYLTSKEDPWCDLSDMDQSKREWFLGTILKDYDRSTEDFYNWEYEVPAEVIEKRLKEKYGCDIGSILHLKPETFGPSGRITALRAEGTAGNVIIGKTLPIRRLLAADCLKSSRFEIEESGNRFILHGHGWGHGVGLCQIGAARMAHEGKSFREILEFYYPNTRLTRIYD